MTMTNETAIVVAIRRDESFARELDRRCHHFTLGSCRACDEEKRQDKLIARLVQVEAAIDADGFAAHEKAWLDLNDELHG